MIIGISGKKQSGKDLIGSIIQYLTLRNKQLPNGYNPEKDLISFNDFNINTHYSLSDWKIKKFADKLKQIVSILTGISVEDLEKEEVKNRPLGEDWRRWHYSHYKLITNTNNGRVSPYFASREEAMMYEVPTYDEYYTNRKGYILDDKSAGWYNNFKGFIPYRYLLETKQ